MIITILQLGFLYGIVVLGLIISFRVIGFADLTMEGSFALGGAVTAIAVSAGMNPWVAMFLGALCGGLAGFFTAALHCFIKINKLLSGIIILTILYTLNIRIMGKPNYSVLDYVSVFEWCRNGGERLLLIAAVAVSVFMCLKWLLSTKFGLFMRATGENNLIVLKSGFHPHIFTISGLVVSNLLIALSGGLLCQFQKFTDVGMGNGLIVSMLTSLVIGENLVRPTNVPRLLLSALFGSIVFQAVVSVALSLGINPWDLKLAIGVFLILMMGFQYYRQKDKVSANIGSSFF